MTRILFALALAVIMGAAPAAAQEAAPVSASSDPVEISARRALEWHRNELKFIAQGDVVAKQGSASIHADTLTADYRESRKSSVDIYRLTADGNVKLENSDGSTGYGDRAVYTLDDGKAVLTGKDLRITMPGRTITASDRMEYDTRAGQARAIGNAKLVEGDNTISAGTLTAFFAPGADGRRALSKAQAQGRVVITTPREKLTGSNGTYNAGDNTAEITGDVRITSGQNVLEGARATVNLATGISTLHGAPEAEGGDGRVRGVFYPQ